jgi:hypothetical protein
MYAAHSLTGGSARGVDTLAHALDITQPSRADIVILLLRTSEARL